MPPMNEIAEDVLTHEPASPRVGLFGVMSGKDKLEDLLKRNRTEETKVVKLSGKKCQRGHSRVEAVERERERAREGVRETIEEGGNSGIRSH